MPLVYLTRKEQFNAAHKLYNPQWSDEENYKVFGLCSNKNWHGHNYDLYVTVKGEPNPQTGFIIDLKELSRIIKEAIIDKVDHKNLNLDVPFMQGLFTSTENLAIQIWKELDPLLTDKGAQLHCIRIAETERNSVEYYGE